MNIVGLWPHFSAAELLTVQVLLAGGLTPADMSLGLIEIKDSLDPRGQVGVDLRESLGDILVDCALGDPEDPGRLPHRVLGPEDVVRDIEDSLPDVVLHPPPPLSTGQS